MNRFFHTASLIIAPLLLLTSCIDSKEEIWLNPSGSGKAHITVSIPSSAITLRGGPDAVSATIDSLLSRHPGISSIHKQITNTDNRSTIEVSFEFDSALRLSTSMAESADDPDIPAPLRHFMGRTTLQQDGLGLTGERVIHIEKAIPGSGLLASATSGRQLQTILHLPIAATEHNATRVENSGKTLIWDIPLSTAMRSAHIQRVQVRAPKPLLAAMIIAAGVIVAAAFLFWRNRSRLRKPVGSAAS